MKRRKHEVKTTEGVKPPKIDPVFSHLILDQLDKLPTWKASGLKRVHRSNSALNNARRRYVLGDDNAMDET